jgi:hypothetical protein
MSCLALLELVHVVMGWTGCLGICFASLVVLGNVSMDPQSEQCNLRWETNWAALALAAVATAA